MGYHSSCVSIQMWTGTYTNAQSVGQLGARQGIWRPRGRGGGWKAQAWVRKVLKEEGWFTIIHLKSRSECIVCHQFRVFDTFTLQYPIVTHIALDDPHGSLLFSEGALRLLDSQVSRVLSSSAGLHPSVHVKTKVLVTLLIRLCSIFTSDKLLAPGYKTRFRFLCSR